MAQPIKFELPKIGSGSTMNGLNGEMDAYIGMATIAAQGIHHTEIAKYIMTACNSHEAMKKVMAAMQNLVDAVDAGEVVITFTGQTHGQPSKLNYAGQLANVDNARAALLEVKR